MPRPRSDTRQIVRCHVCGGTFSEGGTCQRCSVDGVAPEPRPTPPPEPVCPPSQAKRSLEVFKAACNGETARVVALCRAMVRDYPGIGWESTLAEAEDRLARKVGPGPLTLAMGKVADAIPF